MGIFEILDRYGDQFLAGLIVTLKLCLIVWSAGLIGGTALGAMGARLPKVVGYPLQGLAFGLAGIPILVVLYWAHYPLQALLGVVIDPFVTAAGCLGVINVLAVAEVVRQQIRDVPHQYLAAAKVCGLDRRTTLRRVQLPIIVRQLVPALLPLQVVMLHATLFASLISVDELFRVAQRVNAAIYRPVEIYTALALLFLAVSLPLNIIAAVVRRRLSRDTSEA